MVRTANGHANGHAKNGEAKRARRFSAKQLGNRSGAAASGPGVTVETPLPNGATGATIDRAANGRFTPGNQAAVGRSNPFARKLGGLRAAFVAAAASQEQVALVGRKLLELATAGDVAAAALYLTYALGKPGKVIDVDRLDLDELSLLEAAPSVASLVVSLSALRTEALEAMQDMGGRTRDEVIEAIARAFAIGKQDASGKLVRDVGEETTARCRRRARA